MAEIDAPGAEPPLVVGVLGRIRAYAGGQELDLGGPRQRALLAVLAVEVGRTVPTDTLIDAVWDGDPPDAAERTFRTYVSRLRKALGHSGVDGAEVVLTDAAGYRLDDELAAVDASLFEDEVAAARQQLVAGRAGSAVAQLAAALDRWEGRALGAFADRVWAAPSSVRLEEQRLAAEELHVRALLDADRTTEAVARVEELAAAEPLRESVARLHALALYRAGRDADALRVAREFRQRLADEHGLDPSPQVDELTSMILERDPRLDRSVGGERLRGYVLHEPIAHSPLGTVHRAEQPSIGREVAITVLPPERADDPDVVRAFETRVQAVAGLEHPHVLPVYDYWREPGGAYVVTRFPAGGTLAQHLRSGALDTDEALRLGEQVGTALAAAHEAGVVHGDLGPDAVVIDERGDAYVWAFSLVTEAHPRRDVADLADLVATAARGAPDGSGAVRTEQLPEPALAALRRAQDPSDDGIATVAGLAAALRAARTGQDDAGAGPVEVGPNPYRGLAAFREADAGVFFGRASLVERLRARIARTRAVAVVGPSGSGKSSVVRAGLLPQLRADGAYVTTMVPGSRPLAELEVALSRVAAVQLPGVADEVAATPAGLARVVDRALPAADGDLVLVVDQFEELFTVAAPTERDLLLTALRACVEDPEARVRVVVTVRADFLGRVLAHPVAGSLVRDRAVMVTPLTDDELHEVVTGPAEVAGVAVEPALATAIVADATRFPGSLPMVQFALTEVFAAAGDGTMRLDAYRRIGGIEGVLGQRAEEVFAGLDDEGQRAAQVLFQRLVVPNADGPPTRRRALRSEFSHVPDQVIDAFGRARLLRFDNDQATREPTVEVTHEAVLRAWPRLAAWIEEGEDELRILGHLTVAATDWDDRGRAEADLYRGTRLDAALDFAADRREELSDTERAFLDASRARRARDAEAARRSVRRLRMLTAGLAVGLVLALVAGTLAVSAQRREAATAEAAQGDALAFAAAATVTDDLELAALLGAEAYAVSPDPESTGALLAVLGDDPRVRRLLTPPEGGICGTATPGADLFVVQRVLPDGTALADVRTFAMEQVAEVPLPGPGVCPAVDSSGQHLYVADPGAGTVRVLDVVSGEVVAQRGDWRDPENDTVFEMAQAGDEALLPTADGSYDLVSLPDLETVVEYAPADQLPPDLAVASLGESGHLVAAGAGNRVVLLDPGGGVTESPPIVTDDFIAHAVVADQSEVVLALGENAIYGAPLDALDAFVPIPGAGGANGSFAIHPDGDLAAIGTTAGLQLVALPDLEVVGTINVETTFGGVVWGPDGQLFWNGPTGVITMDVDRALGVGTRIASPELADDLGVAQNLAPSADGRSAVHFAVDGRWWLDLDSGESVPIAAADEEPFVLQALLPDHEWLRVDLRTGSVERRRGGQVLATVPLPDDVPRTVERTWSTLRADGPRGTAIVVDAATGNHWVLVFDLATAETVAAIEFPSQVDGETQPVPFEARALPGDRLLIGSNDSQARVLDLEGEVVLGPTRIVEGGEFTAVSPDGSRLAAAGFAGDIAVVDRDLQPVVMLTGRSAPALLLAFVAGDRLVSRHADGATVLWDLATGREIGALFVSESIYPHWFEVADDRRSLIHSAPGGVYEISLDPADWLAEVCRLVSRPLSVEELGGVTPDREPLDPCGVGSGGSGG